MLHTWSTESKVPHILCVCACVEGKENTLRNIPLSDGILSKNIIVYYVRVRVSMRCVHIISHDPKECAGAFMNFGLFSTYGHNA